MNNKKTKLIARIQNTHYSKSCYHNNYDAVKAVHIYSVVMYRNC
jgi:hypothetical protein